jgi:hypothetical protein
MKKFFLFLIILITISCEKDIPNQLTSVEGIVTDYYSMKPVSGISLKVYEHESFVLNGDVLMTDKLISNADGYYYYEFYNKDYRSYEIETLPTEIYYSSSSKTINEGKKDKINFSVKPFKTLTLNCYNQSKTTDKLSVFSYLNSSKFICTQCEELTIVDLKIVPEQENKFSIEVYKENKMDTIRSKMLKFFSGKNDTTINYYY